MNVSELTRRRFLATAAASAASAWLAGCATRRDDSARPRPRSGPAFAQPAILSSRAGRLAVELKAASVEVPWGESTRHAYTYNGTTPGPTLVVRPGDQLVIELSNELDADTNLHTHGLHVSPSGEGDNVFVRVPPGESRTYVYDLPTDHRSGLFWYHPHAHGTVAEQVAAGLAGAIVVLDHIDDITEIASSSERIWILSDPPIGDRDHLVAVSPMDAMVGREGDTVLVNGIERPDLAVRAGTLERWRILNASPSRYYRLALDGHSPSVIATDGGRLRRPVPRDETLLAPGERCELLISPTRAGTYSLRALPYDRGNTGMGPGMMGGQRASSGSARRETVVATMTVTGEADPAPMPATLADPDLLTAPAPSTSRILELGMGMGMGAGMLGARGAPMMAFTIDGKTFSPDRTDITVAAGTTEEWVIRNATPMDHPLHLHVWPFLLASPTTDGEAGWKDTVNIPAGETVRIVVPFTGITGRTVYHCHILDHEDLGMMGVIDITE